MAADSPDRTQEGGGHWLMLLVGALGLAISLLLGWAVWWWQERQLEERFGYLARERMTLIEQRLLLQRRNLANLAGFMQLKAPVGREQFSRFVQPFLHDALAYSWIPRVAGSDRPAVEAEQAAFWPDFQIRDLQADGRLQPAAEREFYFPLLFSQSARLPNLPIGLDLLSHPARREALLGAVREGRLTVSGLLRPVGASEQDAAAVILFMPVFPEGLLPPPALRGNEVRGVVTAVVSLAQVMESRASLGAKQLSLSLWRGDEPLYRSPQQPGAALAWNAEMRLEQAVLRVSMQPTAAFMADNRSLLFIWMTLGGSLATLLLLAVLHLLLHQRQRALRLVAQRTQELRWSEAELRQASARLGHALDGSGDGIWDWTVQSDELFCSAAWANLLGLTSVELPGRLDEWLERVHPQDRDALRHQLQAHCDGQSAYYHHEHRLRHADGHWLWVLDRGRVVERDASGRALRVIGTLSDISARKRGELRLAQALGQLNAILDAATQVAVIATDLEGRITTFNVGAQRMLGYTAEEVIGLHTPELFHDPLEISQHGARLAGAGERPPSGFAALVASAQGLHAREGRDWTYLRKDGSRLTVNLMVSAMRDPEGVPIGYLGVAVDVSAERAARQALQAQQALLEKLSARVPGVIYQYQLRTEGSSCFPWCSEGVREIYELTPEQIREDAALVFTRLHPEDLPLVRQSIQLSAQSLAPWCQEFRVQLPARGLRWLRGEALPERLADGGVLWHGYINDISALKAVEQELRQLAVTDGLTGVYNRRYFQQRLEQQLLLAQRTGEPLALVMLDIDHFKQVNDRFGHDVGDAVLKELCRRLGQRLRRTDVLCRLGGEEFAVLCPGSDLHQACELAEGLWAVVREAPFAGVGQVTASFGVSSWRQEDSVDSLLRRADEGVYAAKQGGRDRICQAGWLHGS